MTAEPREMIFVLHISQDEFLRYYQGAARHVVARGRDGRTVQFPAGLLRPFLVHDGIHGAFRLRYDGRHKLVDIERVEGDG